MSNVLSPDVALSLHDEGPETCYVHDEGPETCHVHDEGPETCHVH